jgi:hypothetical protein
MRVDGLKGKIYAQRINLGKKDHLKHCLVEKGMLVPGRVNSNGK